MYLRDLFKRCIYTFIRLIINVNKCFVVLVANQIPLSLAIFGYSQLT